MVVVLVVVCCLLFVVVVVVVCSLVSFIAFRVSTVVAGCVLSVSSCGFVACYLLSFFVCLLVM